MTSDRLSRAYLEKAAVRIKALWIPTEEYSEADSQKAIEMAEKIFGWVSQSLA
jgi:HEPN domain-containing protein